MTATKPLGITDVVLRDAHQSILATRVRLEDMLPIADKLDQIFLQSSFPIRAVHLVQRHSLTVVVALNHSP